MKQETFAQRLKKALEIRHKKQNDLSVDIGIPKSAISQYMSGKFEAKQDRVFLIAKYLDVSEAWLMGYDVPMERESATATLSDNPHQAEANSLDCRLTKAVEQLNTQGR